MDVLSGPGHINGSRAAPYSASYIEFGRRCKNCICVDCLKLDIILTNSGIQKCDVVQVTILWVSGPGQYLGGYAVKTRLETALLLVIWIIF